MATNLTPNAQAVYSALFDLGVDLRPAPEREPNVTLAPSGDQVLIRSPYNAEQVKAVRALPGRRYDGKDGNFADLHPSVLEFAQRFDLVVADDVAAAIEDAMAAATEAEAIAEAMRVASATADLHDGLRADIALADVMYPYQVVGVDYVLRTMCSFIADQQGLGKTLQALAAVETAILPGLATKGGRVVVVCKSGLRGNWVKEGARWLPHRRFVVANGQKPDFAAIQDADVVVISYDVLSYWVPVLGTPAALIVDESHYIKTPKAQRSIAVTELATKAREAGGMVLLLTGTPTLNRAAELINQLKALGMLEKIAPKPRQANPTERDWEYSFKFRYCGPVQDETGHWTFDGSSNEEELNQKLRSVGYVRRERTQVFTEMSDTTRNDVVLTLNGDAKEYRKAEADFLSWLASTGGDVEKAGRAEALNRLTALRQLIGIAKIKEAIKWIEAFQDENPGQKLVVWAWHKEVQAALVEHFQCPQLLGGEKDPEAQKALFMEGDATVLVCSLQAQSEGHTLTAASNTLFVEQPWTPGGKDQAEDRTNRIGQTEACFAWTLIAEDTIDEMLADIVETKRERITAVNVGKAVTTATENSIKAELLARLANRTQAAA